MRDHNIRRISQKDIAEHIHRERKNLNTAGFFGRLPNDTASSNPCTYNVSSFTTKVLLLDVNVTNKGIEQLSQAEGVICPRLGEVQPRAGGFPRLDSDLRRVETFQERYSATTRSKSSRLAVVSTLRCCWIVQSSPLSEMASSKKASGAR